MDKLKEQIKDLIRETISEMDYTQTEMDFDKPTIEFDPEDQQVANKTFRRAGKGAIGAKAVVPKVAFSYLQKHHKDAANTRVLDFGAGRIDDLNQWNGLPIKKAGYNIKLHDFGTNTGKYIDPTALSNKYDVVYSSNVLNVQNSEKMLMNTLSQINSVLDTGGAYICNLPGSPRKGAYEGMTAVEGAMFLKSKLESVFQTVQMAGGTNGVPVFLCKK